MLGAVLQGKGQIELLDLPLPDRLGDSSTLVRMGVVGLCGSDLYRFGIGKGYGFPLVLGHEISGVIEETSPSGKFKKGDKVAIFPCLPKPDDPMTRIGEFVLSEGYDYFGSRRNGGMQEFLEVPERNLVKVPSDMPLHFAAMVEPAAVALHGVLKLEIPANSTALVIGAGPIGNFAAQWLRFRGVTNVVVSDIDSKKRQVAEELGFQTLEAEKVNTPDAILEITDGRGSAITVEASGSPFTFLQALESTAHSGQVLLLGDLSGDVNLSKELVSRVLRREITIRGTWNSKIYPEFASEWDMVVSAIGKGIDFKHLISHSFLLQDSQSIFEQLFNREIWFNKATFAISQQAQEEVNEILANSKSSKLAKLK